MAKKGTQFVDKDDDRVYPLDIGYNYEFLMDTFMPIGFEIKTFDLDFDPNEVTDGTWEKLVDEEPDRQYIGTQTLLGDEFFSQTGPGTWTIIGASDYYLINGIFKQLTIPAGYHRAYRVGCQIQTGYPGGLSCMKLNNISTKPSGTYSYESFRIISESDYFTEDDIVLEPVINHTTANGINLKCSVSDTNSNYHWYNAEVEGYFESDNPVNVWKRTA